MMLVLFNLIWDLKSLALYNSSYGFTKMTQRQYKRILTLNLRIIDEVFIQVLTLYERTFTSLNYCTRISLVLMCISVLYCKRPVHYFLGDWSWSNFFFYSPPFRWMNHSRRVVVSYKRKYVHEVLVNCLSNLPGKSVVRWTDHLVMTIAVDWGVKQQNKQTCYWQD